MDAEEVHEQSTQRVGLSLCENQLEIMSKNNSKEEEVMWMSSENDYRDARQNPLMRQACKLMCLLYFCEVYFWTIYCRVSVNLFGSEPLGIFKPDHDARSVDVLATWSALEQRELNLAVTHPPSNHFQKMALWTDQGKLWKFPIDNEQGELRYSNTCWRFSPWFKDLK